MGHTGKLGEILGGTANLVLQGLSAYLLNAQAFCLQTRSGKVRQGLLGWVK